MPNPYRGHGGFNPRTFESPEYRRGIFASEELEARERGRAMAAAHMIEDDSARIRVESVYGEAYCRNRYPEVYATK